MNTYEETFFGLSHVEFIGRNTISISTVLCLQVRAVVMIVCSDIPSLTNKKLAQFVHWNHFRS